MTSSIEAFPSIGFNEREYLERVAETFRKDRRSLSTNFGKSFEDTDYVVVFWNGNKKTQRFLLFYGVNYTKGLELAGFLAALEVPVTTRMKTQEEWDTFNRGKQAGELERKRFPEFFPDLVAYSSEEFEDGRTPLFQAITALHPQIDHIFSQMVLPGEEEKTLKALWVDNTLEKENQYCLGYTFEYTDFAVLSMRDDVLEYNLGTRVLLAVSAVFSDRLRACLGELGARLEGEVNESNLDGQLGILSAQELRGLHPDISFKLEKYVRREISGVRPYELYFDEEDTLMEDVRETFRWQEKTGIRDVYIPETFGDTFEETDYAIVKWSPSASVKEPRFFRPFLAFYGCDFTRHEEMRGFIAEMTEEDPPSRFTEAFKRGWERSLEDRWRYYLATPTLLVVSKEGKREVKNVGHKRGYVEELDLYSI